ncbi:MAG TPA: hypothetical protein VF715_19555 [Thermoleophilaceae bacterium]
MRRAAAALAAAAALLALSAVPAIAREQSPRCYPKTGSTGIAASTRVRIFEVERGGDFVVYACDLLTGRRTRIADDLTPAGAAILQIRFAGRWVAFEHSACPSSPPATQCARAVRSLDVQTREWLSAIPGAGISDLVLMPNGAVAWIEPLSGSPGGHAVRRLTRAGAEPLASGPLVQAGSLALAEDATVYWTDGALPRSARLDAVAPGATFQADPEPRGHRKCFPRGSEPAIAASTRVRVYSVYLPEDEEEHYYACDLRSGRRAQFMRIFTDQDGWSMNALTIAGSFVAFGGQGCTKAICGSREMWRIDMSGRLPGLGNKPAGLNHVSDVVLESSGSLAWITASDLQPRPSNLYQVHRCDPRGCAELERGQAIAPTSLAAAAGGPQLYWTRGGEPHSATLE